MALLAVHMYTYMLSNSRVLFPPYMPYIYAVCECLQIAVDHHLYMHMTIQYHVSRCLHMVQYNAVIKAS